MLYQPQQIRGGREPPPPQFRAVWCVNHRLITGSKAERTTSAVVNNFHAKAQNRQAMSFVTSASHNASQNELVGKFMSLLSKLRKLALKGPPPPGGGAERGEFDILKASHQTAKKAGGLPCVERRHFLIRTPQLVFGKQCFCLQRHCAESFGMCSRFMPGCTRWTAGVRFHAKVTLKCKSWHLALR